MLYPSLFFKRHRSLYYELLNAVRIHGEWEAWLDFFAEGLAVSVAQATRTARALRILVDRDGRRIDGLGRAAESVGMVHRALQRQPILSAVCGEKVVRVDMIGDCGSFRFPTFTALMIRSQCH